MKLAINTRNLSGSALLITIVITGVLTLAMSSYLMMISGQYRLTVRSEEWNATIPITEAGVEEALAHLNKNCMTNGINVNPYNPAHDGWAPLGDEKYQKTTYLAEGAYYVATIDLLQADEPKIFCEGYTPSLFVGLTPKALFATVGNEDGVQTSKPFQRNVAVTTRLMPVFTHALAADGGINLNGHNVATDSFNSTNGPYSSSNRRDNGDVATNSDLTDALNVGNANIRGNLSIGPGGDESDIAIGPNGVVGNNEFVDGGNTGIQDGYWNDDMNVEFETVEVPFDSPNQGVRPNHTVTISSNTVVRNVVGTCSCSGGNNCCIPPNEELGGVVEPVTEQATTAGYPPSGSNVGTVSTNWTLQSSSTYPSGTVRNVQTNSTAVTSEHYAFPAAGTYVGNVSTNIVETKSDTAPARYEPGTLEQKGSKWYYDVQVYHYQNITGYTYEKLTSYTFASITGYQRVISTTTVTTNSVEFHSAFLYTGNYEVGSLSGRVYVGAPEVVVYCTGSFSPDMLYIAPGASLRIYVAGNVDISGNQTVNEGGFAKNMSLYGLPSCTSIQMTGNGEFTGTIYAPKAHLKLGGGGSDTKDFFGAVIVGSAALTGHMHFHYDEDLMKAGPSRGYIANSWREQ